MINMTKKKENHFWRDKIVEFFMGFLVGGGITSLLALFIKVINIILKIPDFLDRILSLSGFFAVIGFFGLWCIVIIERDDC